MKQHRMEVEVGLATPAMLLLEQSLRHHGIGSISKYNPKIAHKKVCNRSQKALQPIKYSSPARKQVLKMSDVDLMKQGKIEFEKFAHNYRY